MRKVPLVLLKNNDFVLSDFDDRPYYVPQGDNMLFRQLRRITGCSGKRVDSFAFVSCQRSAANDEALEHIIRYGFDLNGRHFIMSERSASMTRSSILGFVDAKYAEELNEVVSMGNDVGKTVLSKYYAYRGLMLSSCHCLEGWRPKIIVVPDKESVIADQHIKYIYDAEKEFVDKNGNTRLWKQKDIGQKTTDVKINVFDGCGIHHPEIGHQVYEILNAETQREKEPPTSMLLRAPYIKGVTHEVDYTAFYKERGIRYIRDVWGVSHDVEEPMIIISESMYKGYKYFNKTGTFEDWQRYWELFEKYDHCIGLAKWNYTKYTEPRFTRTSYQILQDLKLDYEDFAKIASESIYWAQKIQAADPLYTMCFMGLTADRCEPRDDIARAVLKDPAMLGELGVRSEIMKSAEKYIDGMKCGKLWVKGAFKFLAPDLIMFMEHIAGLPANGCLNAGEFYGHDFDGVIEGNRLVERNPHICHSEHTVLKGVRNDLTDRYFSRLDNVCMINGKSIVPQKLNGADFDGDLVFVIDNETMMCGVDTSAYTVMDVDDKVTVESEDDTPDNRVKVTMRSMKNMIGEFSNYSTAYHNKMPKTAEQKEKYEKYVDIISVLTGKSIDYAKTGVLYMMPRFITKYGRPLPQFMKYASSYYAKQKLSNAPSNMNKLCREVEKWHRHAKWDKAVSDFDYTIMLSPEFPVSEEQKALVDKLYAKFNALSAAARKACGKSRIKYEVENDAEVLRYLTVDDSGKYDVSWKTLYSDFRDRCLEICGDIRTAANAAVMSCYATHKNGNKKFMWRLVSDGIVANIEQKPVVLPVRRRSGEYEYLGKRYDMEEYTE